MVYDFEPKLLSIPGILNAERFIEYYLGLNAEYHRIQYDRKVLGMTAFNNGYIQVANEVSGKPEPMPVTKGTVIIDTSLTAKSSLPRLRFTILHEGSHWLIHRRAFDENNPLGYVGVYENQFLAAKEGRIDYSRSQKERCDIEKIERQADFLASAILMPRPALRTAYRDFFRFHGEKPRRIYRGGGSRIDEMFAVELPRYVANEFGVSVRAALIRLEKLTAIVDSRKWKCSFI